MPRRSYTEIIRQRRVATSAPEPAADPAAQVERINELTRTARTSWFGLLSYLAFVGVTLLGVEDADFFITERQTDLPLVGVSIPTVQFFWVAPFLGASLYAYFHFHLLKLYEVLGSASVDGQMPLSDRVTPWLITDFALAWRKGALTRRPMRWLALGVALLLAYLAGPIVLGSFWYRSWPYHHEWLTVLGCGIPFLVALYAGMASWAHMQRLVSQRRRRLTVNLGLRVIYVTLAICVMALGWFTTEGSLERYMRHTYKLSLFDRSFEHGPFFNEPIEYRISESRELIVDNPAHDHWWGNPILDTLLYPANLAGVDFVGVPDGWREHDTALAAFRAQWCDLHGIPEAACGLPNPWDLYQSVAQIPLAEATFDWCNERILFPSEGVGDRCYAEPETQALIAQARLDWCGETILVTTADFGRRCTTRFEELDRRFWAAWETEWQVHIDRLTQRDLSGADLRRAILVGAQMQGMNLQGARLHEADLSTAQVQGARLDEVQMHMAILTGAQMQVSTLYSAELQGANFAGAQMQGANFREAQMQGAQLPSARMQGAIFISAQLQGADFSISELQGANFSHTQMQTANLFRAGMQGTILFRAEMQAANLSEALMQGTSLRFAQLQGANLVGAQMSEGTLASANLRGAAIGRVDDTTLSSLQSHRNWTEVFHNDSSLEYTDFITSWRAFAADLDPPVTIAPDYNRTD